MFYEGFGKKRVFLKEVIRYAESLRNQITQGVLDRIGNWYNKGRKIIVVFTNLKGLLLNRGGS